MIPFAHLKYITWQSCYLLVLWHERNATIYILAKINVRNVTLKCCFKVFPSGNNYDKLNILGIHTFLKVSHYDFVTSRFCHWHVKTLIYSIFLQHIYLTCKEQIIWYSCYIYIYKYIYIYIYIYIYKTINRDICRDKNSYIHIYLYGNVPTKLLSCLDSYDALHILLTYHIW